MRTRILGMIHELFGLLIRSYNLVPFLFLPVHPSYSNKRSVENDSKNTKVGRPSSMPYLQPLFSPTQSKFNNNKVKVCAQVDEASIPDVYGEKGKNACKCWYRQITDAPKSNGHGMHANISSHLHQKSQLIAHNFLLQP